VEENIISGLISGITVAFLVLVLRSFWAAIIIPWFEERVYKDVKIEGKWFCLYPTSKPLRQEVIVLKRHGHSVVGTMTCIEGADVGDEYSICGSFRNMLLPLTYESTDKTKTDRGSMTFICQRNGERLTGTISLYNTVEDRISAANIIWFRSKDDLNKTITKIESRRDEIEKIREERKRLSEEEKEIETVDNNDITERELTSTKAAADKSSQEDADKAGTSS